MTVLIFINIILLVLIIVSIGFKDLGLFYKILIAVIHFVFCFAYWFYTLSNTSDAIAYYEDGGGGGDFMPGTAFVAWLTGWLINIFSASYLDCFLFFSLLGLVGLFYLARIIKGLTATSSGLVKLTASLIPLMPTLNFWTVAIGKDGIAFYSICVAIYALMDVARRKMLFSVSIAAMFMVRPHICAVMILAAVVAIIISKGMSIKLRAIASTLGVGVATAIIVVAIAYVGLDEADGVLGYAQSRQGENTEGGSSIDLSNSPLYVVMFGYLFRPLFFDAPGFLGLVTSVENLLLLAVALFKFRVPSSIRAIRENPAFTFCTIYFLVTLLLLSFTTANLGIALRQKTMILPALFFLCFSNLRISSIGQR